MSKAIKLAIGLGLACSALAFAQNCDSLLEQVRAKYQKINDLKSRVVQTVCSAASGTCTRYEGGLELKRPNKLRMDISKPDKQQIICDGSAIWLHLINDKQVLKSDLKSSPQFLVWLNPLDKLLSGRAKDGCRNDGEYLFFMEPDELKDIIKAIKIVVDIKSLLITGMEAVDVNGNSAEYSFSKIKINPGLKDKRFEFIIPKNAEINENQ
ncbi:outer membrane lipoprotein chaperone LolA [candidate division TA06 bacterium]|uniref:Outer-membrane lipoprotein carrier protein n=1 Tax=candidate division TA06 bacterium TaxID=2250710 RepID=A0A933MK40_UNCT6|nr:outer membrane lipoprotein chaperone LolA [candidate division TA06 bacterium]